MGKWLILVAIATLGAVVQADDMRSTTESVPANQPPDCTSYRDIVGQYLHLPQFTEGNDTNGIVSEACKRLPDREQVSAVAYGYTPDGANEDEKSLLVALVDDRTRSVIGAYTSHVREDALTKLGELGIDAARYRLAKDVRAVGLRFTSAGHIPKCAEAGAKALRGQEWQRLFVEQAGEWGSLVIADPVRSVWRTACTDS
ncbi:MAG: hypothetical protein JO218_04200 [Burkholderiales bacterium]|nr:hypothetical protein [Burkholderiales bacterium]